MSYYPVSPQSHSPSIRVMAHAVPQQPLSPAPVNNSRSLLPNPNNNDGNSTIILMGKSGTVLNEHKSQSIHPSAYGRSSSSSSSIVSGISWSCLCGLINSSDRRSCHECGNMRSSDKQKMFEQQVTKDQERESEEKRQAINAEQGSVFDLRSRHNGPKDDASLPVEKEFELEATNDPMIQRKQNSLDVAVVPPRPTLEVPQLRTEAHESVPSRFTNPSSSSSSDTSDAAASSHPLHHASVLQLPHTHLSQFKWSHIVRVLSAPIVDLKVTLVDLHAGLATDEEPFNDEAATTTDAAFNQSSSLSQPAVETDHVFNTPQKRGSSSKSLTSPPSNQAAALRARNQNPNNAAPSPSVATVTPSHPYKQTSASNKKTKSIPPWIASLDMWLKSLTQPQRDHFYAASLPFLQKLVLTLPLLFQPNKPLHVLSSFIQADDEAGLRRAQAKARASSEAAASGITLTVEDLENQEALGNAGQDPFLPFQFKGVHLTAEQCGALLAVGFFGLHVQREPLYRWTNLNFDKLFLFLNSTNELGHSQENKLRCLLNYFSVLKRQLYPSGIVPNRLGGPNSLGSFTPSNRLVSFHRTRLPSGGWTRAEDPRKVFTPPQDAELTSEEKEALKAKGAMTVNEVAQQFTVQRMAHSGTRLAPISIEYNTSTDGSQNHPETEIVCVTHPLLGSGALNRSASAEESRYFSSPESLVTLALAELLAVDESWIVTGALHCNQVIGEGKHLQFQGSLNNNIATVPSHPIDHNGQQFQRINSYLIFIDPLVYDFNRTPMPGTIVTPYGIEQYTPHLLLRELRKLYAGVGLPSTSSVFPAIFASASHYEYIHQSPWGCGKTHGGDLQLKFLLQWMAISLTTSGLPSIPPTEELTEYQRKKGATAKTKSVHHTTLTGNLSPLELMALPPPRKLIFHPTADPRAEGLQHFVDFLQRHPLGGVTEWTDDSITTHGLSVGKLWIALMSYADELRKQDGPVLQSMRKEELERRQRAANIRGEPLDLTQSPLPGLGSPAIGGSQLNTTDGQARAIPLHARPLNLQTSSSLLPTNLAAHQQATLYTPTFSVFQWLERYFDLMWLQMEQKKSNACTIL